MAVPKALRPVLGTRLKRDLKTDSLAVANRLKLQVVAELQSRIDAARQDHLGKPKNIIREAVEIARMAERTRGPYERAEIEACIRERAEDILGAEVGYRAVLDEDGQDDIEPVYDPKRKRLMEEFVAAANGMVLPLAAMHEDYLSRTKVKRRTKADDVRALRYLTTWCERERLPGTVQTVTRKVAVRFSDALSGLCGGLTEVTQNKYLNRLSRYWQYLLKRELVESNPFAALKVEVPSVPKSEQERSFTDSEVQRLLMGGAQIRLHDLMMIGALTGARLDAIVDMRVKDAADGLFTFKPQKKELDGRDIPIHPALQEIVDRRIAGKAPEDEFFPDWPPPRPGSDRERSFKASNAFTTYRRAVGVDETLPGKRRALTNFHSFRRWFCTRAERTGYSGDLVAAIVGHQRAGITLSRYSEGPEMDAARDCISLVTLPPLDGSPVKEQRSLRSRSRFLKVPTSAEGSTSPEV